MKNSLTQIKKLSVALMMMAGVSAFAQDAQNSKEPALPAKQTADIQIEKTPEINGNDVLAAWSDDMVSALFKEIYALGFQEEIMTAEFDAIAAEKDPAIKEALTKNYRKKYTGIAIGALRNLALQAKAPDAIKVVDQLQSAAAASQASAPIPRDIALIYRDLDQIPDLAQSPCMTASTRTMCALAPFFGKECKYTKVRDVPSVAYNGDRDVPNLLWTIYRYSRPSGLIHWISVIHENTDDRHLDDEASFAWPLTANDHAMCIDGDSSHVRLNASATSGIGGATIDESWSLFLRGAQGSRHGGNGGICQASVHAETDTFSADQSRSVFFQNSACWFRGLNDLFRSTYPLQAYPAIPGDPDTANAARIEVVNRLEVHADLSLSGRVVADAAANFYNVGVLVLRDRSCTGLITCK